MAEFAIGSIASMAIFNPQITIRGTVPILGYHLSVHWNYTIALAACIAVVHWIFLSLMLWVAQPIIVGADSNLVNAKLLQGLVGRLGERGVLLDGKEIAAAIEREGIGADRRVVYGVKEENAIRTLKLGQEVAARNGGKFPSGVYA